MSLCGPVHKRRVLSFLEAAAPPTPNSPTCGHGAFIVRNQAVNARRLLHRATIFYTAMQGLRRIMEKPHDSIGKRSPRQETVVEVGRSGVTPIAFRAREYRRIRGLPIFLRKHPPVVGHSQAGTADAHIRCVVWSLVLSASRPTSKG